MRHGGLALRQLGVAVTHCKLEPLAANFMKILCSQEIYKYDFDLMHTNDTRNITFSQLLTWHIVKKVMKNVMLLDLLIYADSPLSILFFVFFIGVMFCT